jgi:hypothetical protein
VHDYFAILGIAPGASAAAIRSAHSRRRAAVHPDFRASEDRPIRTRALAGRTGRGLGDAAVNFIEMSILVDRMEAAFFRSRG